MKAMKTLQQCEKLMYDKEIFLYILNQKSDLPVHQWYGIFKGYSQRQIMC